MADRHRPRRHPRSGSPRKATQRGGKESVQQVVVHSGRSAQESGKPAVTSISKGERKVPATNSVKKPAAFQGSELLCINGDQKWVGLVTFLKRCAARASGSTPFGLPFGNGADPTSPSARAG